MAWEYLLSIGIQEYGLFDAVNFLVKEYKSFETDLSTKTKLSARAKAPNKTLLKPDVGTQPMKTDRLVSAAELNIVVAANQPATSCAASTPTVPCALKTVSTTPATKASTPARVHGTRFDMAPSRAESRPSTTQARSGDSADDKKAQSSSMLQKNSPTRGIAHLNICIQIFPPLSVRSKIPEIVLCLF